MQTRCPPLDHQPNPPRVPHPQGTRAANTSPAPRHHRPPQATQRCRVQRGANVTDARHRPHSAWPPARAGGQRAFTTLRSPDRALSGAESRSQPPDRAASAGAVQGSAAWGPPPGPRCPRMRTPDKGGRSLAAQPRPPAPLPATDTPHRRRSTSPSLVTRTTVPASAAVRAPPPAAATRATVTAGRTRACPAPPVPGGPGRGPRQGDRCPATHRPPAPLPARTGEGHRTPRSPVVQGPRRPEGGRTAPEHGALLSRQKRTSPPRQPQPPTALRAPRS